jgi:hypothetical protein
VTRDEAIAAMGSDDPVVRWRDKHSRWRYARLIGVAAKWATVETGGGDLPTWTTRVRIEDLRERKS